ncbi:MAG TPA: peptidoglycan editing factor PgeF [Oxalicibacterium sp.]|nr:peptidoglycan editing factor PgeF [Oxalicibacterium sp.]
MEIILPQWGTPLTMIGALSTTRACGFSTAPYDDGQGAGGLNLATHVGDEPETVQRNRAQLQRHLPSEPAWLTQVHGTTVVDAATLTGPVEADASFTTQPGVVCAILTADCLPVLLADKGGKVVGAAHAGWRGLAGGVLQNTIAQMQAAGGTELFAWLGPAIGPAHFEVGEDVRQAFADHSSSAAAAFKSLAGRPGKYLADLYGLATDTLHRAGVAAVQGGRLCTVAEPHRFYSYRRDGVTGRMATLIWLR